MVSEFLTLDRPRGISMSPLPVLAAATTRTAMAFALLLFASSLAGAEESADCGRWTETALFGSLPNPRINAYVIQDHVRNRLVVFGGEFSGTPKNDLWQLSLATYTWSPVAASGSAPVPRMRGAAVFDAARDRMLVLFGETTSNYTAEVWSLSLGEVPAWTQLSPTGTPPSGRNGVAVIHDPARDRVLVFGGFNGNLYSEVWALDLGGPTPAWSQLSVSGGPTPRKDAAAVYDPVRDRMLVFGGQTSAGRRGDLWALELAGTPQWIQLFSPTFMPPPRSSAAAVFDVDRDRMLIHGGSGPGSSDFRSDTWVIDFEHGSTAFEITAAAGTAPGANRGHFVTLEPTSQRIVMFGSRADGYRVALHQMAPEIQAVAAAVPAARGSVSWTPQSCVSPGAEVTFTATAAPGYRFDHWSEDGSATANPLVLAATESPSVVAHFVEDAPVITNVQPARGPEGATVNITGVSFTGATEVTFDGVPAEFQVIYPSLIQTVVPPGATDGLVRVTTPFGTATSPGPFNVDPDPLGWIDLSWDDCGAAGVAVKTFACDSNAGAPHALVASFTSAIDLPRFFGLDAALDFEPVGSEELPDWWKHGADECRGTNGLSVHVADAPSSCVDPYGGVAYAAMAYDVGYGAPHRARLRVQAVLPHEAPASLVAGTEYFAFEVRIRRNRTIGLEQCTGCEIPMSATLAHMYLFQDPSENLDPYLHLPRNGNSVEWQSFVTSVGETDVGSLAIDRIDWTRVGGRVAFTLPRTGDVKLEVFDAAGRRRASRRIEGLDPGSHEARLENALRAGVYFARLTLGGRFTTRRFVLAP